MTERSDIFVRVSECVCRLGRRWLYAGLVVAGLLVGSCERGSDNIRHEPEKEENGGKDDNRPNNPGDDVRPGPSDKEPDFTAEFADDVLRYVGTDLVMRFDRGGILVKVHADGRREMIDLDGDARVVFTAGERQPDSLHAGSILTVNGADIRLKTVRMKKQTAEAVWYHIVDKDDKSHVIVVP